MFWRYLFAALLGFLLYRLAGRIARSLAGRPPQRPRPAYCPRCRGTGWIAVEAATRRACECGSASARADGPVIDLEEER